MKSLTGRNGWLRVTVRRVNQFMRRQVIRQQPARQRRLWAELIRLAHERELTEAQLDRMGAIHWQLGSGNLYVYTADERQRQKRLAEGLLDDLKRELEKGGSR